MVGIRVGKCYLLVGKHEQEAVQGKPIGIVLKGGL